jgi:hypothetical protein
MRQTEDLLLFQDASMSLNFSALTKHLFRKFTQKPSTATNRFRPAVTALEDRVVPIATTVSVETLSHAVEGGTVGTFRLTRIGDLSSSQAVNFSVGGTAASGTDFTSVGTSVTFAAELRDRRCERDRGARQR